MPLVPLLDLPQFDPEYSTADLEKAKSLDFGEENPNGEQRKNKKGVIVLPEYLVEPIWKHFHEATHYERKLLTTILQVVIPYNF